MSEVDPRFDPRYQRGYDPVAHPAPAPVVPEPEPAPLAPVEELAPVARAATPPAESLGVVGAESPESAVRGPRNPYRLALLVTSVVFLVLALALLAWTITPTAVPDTAYVSYSYLRQIAPFLAIPFAIAGTLGLVGWVALGELLPRRRAE